MTGGWWTWLGALFRKPSAHWRTDQTADALTPAGNAVPRPIHACWTAPKPGRVVIVGDVHGCAAELHDLLSAAQFDPLSDNLILVGDLVNKGPSSAQVLRAARELGALAVRGNHDDSALAAWHALRNGAGAVKATCAWVEALTAEDVSLLEGLPFSLALPEYRVVVVHAALVPGVAVQQQQLWVTTKARDLRRLADGRYEPLEKGQPDSTAWATLWPGPQHVFFGHDAKRRQQLCDYATGLDTGCVYGGQLTACILPPLSHLQRDGDSAFVRKLASGEPLLLSDLGGQLVSVPARQQYEGRKG